MSGARYIVRSYRFGFLILDGPFAYARWTDNVTSASTMSFAIAHQWAAVYGGEVARFGA